MLKSQRVIIRPRLIYTSNAKSTSAFSRLSLVERGGMNFQNSQPNGKVIAVPMHTDTVPNSLSAGRTEVEYLFSLKELLRVLRRRLWVIVLVAVVLAGAVVGFDLLRTPTYEATIKILVGKKQENTGIRATGPARITTGLFGQPERGAGRLYPSHRGYLRGLQPEESPANHQHRRGSVLGSDHQSESERQLYNRAGLGAG